jgi:hypothetical protein
MVDFLFAFCILHLTCRWVLLARALTVRSICPARDVAVTQVFGVGTMYSVGIFSVFSLYLEYVLYSSGRHL